MADGACAMRLPDGTWYQLQDLPWAHVEEIEAKHHTSWMIIIDTPTLNGAVLLDLARAIAIENDFELPAVNTSRDLIRLAERFGIVGPDGFPIEEAPAPIAWAPTG
jgi:hypothetical protein